MILYPNAYFDRVEDITIEFLNKNKIKVLILDVDNTLINYKKELSKEVIDWANDMKGQGIKLYILSNSNDKQKVEKLANTLKISYRYFAKKPLKSGFLKIQKELQEEPEKIGVVGDQVFTDIIGGNRCKMYTILVEPIDKKEFWYTAWKRPLENKIKNKYRETKEK